ncbi:MAG: hypothetical protein AAGA30_09770, partial [Planctomycetota bacterium]
LSAALLFFASNTNAQIVLHNGPAGDTVGFTFDSFVDGLAETGSSFVIDVSAFGGCGTDVPPVQVETTSQLRIVYQVLGDNNAPNFDIALRDNDGDDSGPGLGTEEFVYRLATDGGTSLGNGFEEQIVSLNSFLFRQQAFGFVNDGDGIVNLGLDQWKIQSIFGATDRLNIEVETIEIVGAESVFIYNGCAGDSVGFTFDSFIFGLNETGTSFTVDVESFGGTGLGFGLTDVDANTAQLRVVYRALKGNVAAQFEVLLQDNDGDDTGPGLGNEEYLYPFPFEGGSPLGDGSGFDEQLVALTDFAFRQQSFGFINDGDEELNYGAVQWNLQSSFGSTDRLALEVKSIELVLTADECLLGDVNLDGLVDLLDVAPFVDILANGGFQKEADTNEDGIVSLLDVGPFVDILTGG